MKPNPKWNAMVMIVTPILIVGLLQGGLYQRVIYLKKKLEFENIPYPLPVFPYGETEVQKAEKEVEILIEEAQEKKELIKKALQYNIELPKPASIEEWQRIVREEGERKYLLSKTKALLEEMKIQISEKMFSVEEHPKIWYSALTNLNVKPVSNNNTSFVIMQAEMTYALRSLLEKVPLEDNTLLNRPIQVDIEHAYRLADVLSDWSDVEMCYENCKKIPCISDSNCLGWRLPKRSEWLSARGDIDQKWTYMSWLATSLDVPQPISMKAPNQNAIHDILGNVSEWVEEGNAMGGDYTSSLEDALDNQGKTVERAGVRLVRIQENP
ncbi:MAG: hypothetical protein VX278_21290 [Myxococcota bacterium]|nr:hypothetical protein [Myxococcota bacterium]